MAELNTADIETGMILNVSSPGDVIRVVPIKKDDVLSSASRYELTNAHTGERIKSIHATGSHARDFLSGIQNLIGYKKANSLTSLPGVETGKMTSFNLYPRDSFLKVEGFSFNQPGMLNVRNLETNETETLSADQIAKLPNAKPVSFEAEPAFRNVGTKSATYVRDTWLKKFDKTPDQLAAANDKIAVLEAQLESRNKAAASEQVQQANSFAAKNPHSKGFDPDATIDRATLPEPYKAKSFDPNERMSRDEIRRLL